MKWGRQALLSLAVLAVAGALWVRHFPQAGAFVERLGFPVATASVEAPAAEGAGRGGPPVVIGQPVGEATINDRVSAIGDGRAIRSVTISPYDPGRVAAVEVASGAFVTAGTPIVRLDQEAEEIALDRARLALEDARTTLKRNQLVGSRGVTEAQLHQSELAVSEGELEVRDAEVALDHRVIRAPFDGWVGIISVDVGDHVEAQTGLGTLDDRSHILVDFRIPERFVAQVRPGLPVSARPLAHGGVSLDGEIATLDTRVDPATRTLRVRASLDNADDRLRAGMAFSIGLRFPGESYPAVDPLAVQWSAEGPYVWVARDGKAAQVPVRILQREDDAVLVDADLAPGTRVVTEGVQLLREGAPFRFEGDAPAGTTAAPPARSGG
ncbi:MAG: efflux RND transporter periplasmic adaptor subunit [Amaricoccus sp.]|uniref:efflux RND transporter periplasmic adaptor subunit n=1 Tax=Amaricoccus sp. TaxID=1872485 RepID=UPI0039E24329